MPFGGGERHFIIGLAGGMGRFGPSPEDAIGKRESFQTPLSDFNTEWLLDVLAKVLDPDYLRRQLSR